MIYWTNILIQCPVPVPVCCMFFVSQKIHIKRSPNAIKFHGELFWNICDFWELESPQKEAHTTHKTPGRAWAPRRALVPSGPLENRPVLFLLPKIHIYSKINL